MDGQVAPLTSATLEHLVASARPALVDFWADQCPPCRALAPILGEIAAEHRDELIVGSVKLDDFPDLAQRFEIQALPTLILFVDGEPRRRILGAVNKADILRDLRDVLSTGPR